MGSGRGRKTEETTAKNQATAAINEYKEDPLEVIRRDRTMKFLKDFDSGKDVKDMDAMRSVYDLFNNAKSSQANQQIGKGVVALGSPSAAGQVSDMDKYVQAQREQDAAGMLYNATNQAYGDALGESQYLINTSQGRLANKANMFGQMYQSLLNKPQQAPLWERLAGLAIGGLGAAGSFRGR